MFNSIYMYMYINNNTTTNITTTPPSRAKAMTINLTTYLHYWNTMGGNTNTCSTLQSPLSSPKNSTKSPTTTSSSLSSLLGGRILPLLERLLEKGKRFDWYVLGSNVMVTVHWCDLLLLLAWGWLLIPASAVVYKSLYYENDADADYAIDTDDEARQEVKIPTMVQQKQQQPLFVVEATSSSATAATPQSSSFRQSRFFVVARKFSQLGRLCTCLYLFDCLVIAFQATIMLDDDDMGNISSNTKQQKQDGNDVANDDFFFLTLSSPVAKVVTLVWATMTVSQLVTYWIDQFVLHRTNILLPNNTAVPFNIATASTPEIQERAMRKLQLGVLQSRLHVANAIFHMILAAWTFYIIFEVLETEIVEFMGSSSSSSSPSSIIALGSAGTMLLGWAARDWAAMLFAGITLSLSNRVQEGNEIAFVDSGMSGFIHHIGWMQTTIRGYNEIFTVVPNTQLVTQRVRNISRTFRCQVKENLRICYKDAHKLRAFLPDVLNEIKASCPEVIADGTRPFRAVWVGYGEDHIKVMVDTHFELRPTGQKYWENKQEVMFAIYRAAEKHDIHFVTTMRWPIVTTTEQCDDKSATPGL
jgi:small-conductance mechanosensitive channel